MSSEQIPTSEPTEITRGATVAWTRSLSDYPASDGWTLTTYFRGAGAGVDVVATADGDDYSNLMTAAQSATLAAGAYYWQTWIALGDARHQVGAGNTSVKLGFTDVATTTGVDGRSDARIIYDRLLELFKTKTLMVQAEYTIAGRQMRFESYDQLLMALKAAAATVRDEQRVSRANKGGDFFSKVNVRF